VSRSFIFLEVFDSATMAAYYFLKKVAWIIHLLTCRKLPVKVQATEVHYFVVVANVLTISANTVAVELPPPIDTSAYLN
jgi:hypothetical protein